MKKAVQELGKRDWYGGDLVALQHEPLSALDAMVSEYGSFILQGCVVSESLGKYNISSGFVVMPISGAMTILPVEGVQDVTIPVFIVPRTQIQTRTYEDGGVKPVVIDNDAYIVSERPVDGEYMELGNNDVPRFFDAISKKWRDEFVIQTPKIQDKAVTTPKLADGAVTGVKVGNGAIGSIHLERLSYIYDVVIRSQKELDLMLASEDWLGAKSVAIVNVDNVVYTGNLIVPDTEMIVQGFGQPTIQGSIGSAAFNSKLHIDGFVVAYTTAAESGYGISGALAVKNSTVRGFDTGITNCREVNFCNIQACNTGVSNCAYPTRVYVDLQGENDGAIGIRTTNIVRDCTVNGGSIVNCVAYEYCYGMSHCTAIISYESAAFANSWANLPGDEQAPAGSGAQGGWNFVKRIV